MFLILFKKKRILDSTSSSQQQPTDNQFIYEPISNAPTTTTINELQLIPKSNNHQHNQQQLLPQLHRTLIHFIIATTNLANKIFIESLATLGRCLNISLRTLLNFLSSITSQCTEAISVSGVGLGSSSNLNPIRDTNHSLDLATQPTPLAKGTRSTGGLFGNSNSYLHAIAEASEWSKATVAAIGVAVSLNESSRSETIYYEPLSAYVTTTSEIAADNSYQCDTIEMDFCRRRITQRAASNSHHHIAGAPTNTTSCYWDYQAPPMAAFSAQTCTSVGPQVPEENKATESCRQLRREQLRPQFQGQREQQRSCGLQIDMEKCRQPECSKQQRQQITLLQHQQQQKLQRSQHDTQAPKSSKYTTSVAQSSSSSASSFISSHHNPPPHQQHQGSRSGSMNFNAHTQHQILQEQEHKQQQQAQRVSRGQQDVAAEAVHRSTGASMVLVSKETISHLTDQVARSMNKMKDLEERVRVLPELQRRLDSVFGDSNSSGGSDFNHLSANISGNRNNSSNYKDSNYHLDNHSQKRQNFSYSIDNVAPYRSDSCNRNIASNYNRANNSDEIFRGIHPSLQRHYNSFRCATNNKSRDASCFSMKDSISPAQTTAGKFSIGSPLTGSRDFNFNGSSSDAASLTNNHISNSSRQSLPISNSTTNMLRSNPNLYTNRCSSPKVGYEDLINDLISLSYSVNYPSSNTSLSNVQSLSGKRSEFQAKEHLTPAKSTEHEQLRQASKRSSPSVSKLDCGCQSFKEHLRYNTISREQRMQHTRSQSASYTSANSNFSSASPQSTPNRSSNSKKDASTNTELYMDDIVTRVELNSLITSMQKTYSTLSSIASRVEETTPIQFKNIAGKSYSIGSESTSDSMSGPKSSSPLESRSDSCDDDQQARDDEISEPKSQFSSGKGSVDENDNPRLQVSDDDDEDDDEEEEEEEEGTGGTHSNVGSVNCEGPYSLGSSYQDPSDFEEYCAYGESLDRRTKDFMSQSTKIPNDLRFALIRLNDIIKRNQSSATSKPESSSSCIEVIRKEWFLVAANEDSQPAKTKLYIDYFESFTKQLLNTVVNLCDDAGNTAMHYAASLYKLDIIKVLLDTKVCDVNSRNKAGYTPIMLIALADIKTSEDQEVARHLFSIGDVNIKARANGQTAIMLAASHGRISTCKLLLESGADPSLQDYDGSTALMCASEIGNEEVVRCLLAHKLTDPNAVDNDGLDAITIAMNNGHKNIGLILYAAKNVPRMVRTTVSSPMYSNSSGYLGASLRRNRGKLATNYVRRADSLLGSRSNRQTKHSQT